MHLLIGNEDNRTASKAILQKYGNVVAYDTNGRTLQYAAERYLQSRKDGSLNPIEQDTYDHYASLINQRLIPFCDDKGIVYIRDFENKDVCSQFTESWRQLRRNTGALLAMTTRRTELERFRTFLRECVENRKSGGLLKDAALLRVNFHYTQILLTKAEW